MRKKAIKYFGVFTKAQQNWLNAMSNKGYRLIKTGRLVYEFEECEPNKYQYYVDFVGHQSNSELKRYKNFLADLGYIVISKNANINYSLGKVRFRPYGKGWGKIATSPGNYNKELLIIEKVNDGKPFEIHTTAEDKLALCKIRRNVYITLFVLFLFLYGMQWLQTKEVINASIVFVLFAIISLVPIMVFSKKIDKLKRQSSIYE